MSKRKLRLGWFSFTCCEDSSIVFTELLNEYYFKWVKVIDFAYVRMLKTKNSLKNLDVAFVEGAISSKRQKTEVQKIRKNCKKLIAVGACAVTGKPSGARNDFSPDVVAKYKKVFDTFKYSDKVLRLDEVVKVDDKIPGCPMRGEEFVKKLNEILSEFHINNA